MTMNPTNHSKQDMELRKRILYLVLKYGNDFAERRRSEDADEEATTDAIMQLIQSHDEARERDIKRKLLLQLGKGDPQSAIVFQARIAQEISSIELATHPNENGEE